MSKPPELRVGVPLPKRGYKPRANSIASRLRALEPDQMLFFEGLNVRKLGGKVHSITSRLRPAKYVVRAIDGGAGVWRIS